MNNSQDKVIYIVKCPKCDKKANAIMTLPVVLSGTYREATYKLKAKLIQCNNCGFIKELSDKNWNDYELWYKTNLSGHSLWAKNENHLNFMIEWFSKKTSKPYSEYESSEVEAYPKWMILDKEKTLKELIKLKQKNE